MSYSLASTEMHADIESGSPASVRRDPALVVISSRAQHTTPSYRPAAQSSEDETNPLGVPVSPADQTGLLSDGPGSSRSSITGGLRYGASPVSDNPSDPLLLSARKMDPDEIKRTHRGRMGRKVMQFYEAQNELIDDLLRPAHYREPGEEQRLVKLKIAVYGTVAVNVLLLGLQLYAAISSGSLSLFATCFDAFLDLACNGVLLYTSWTSKKSNPEKFPVGARRLETAGIIVFSCLMASLSVQLLTEAGRSLAAGFREFDLTPLTIGIIGFAIFIKVVMFCYCWIMRQYPTAKVLAQDNINDVVLNTFGVTLSYLGFRYVWWLDPAGAIIIGLLIMRSWATTAYEQIQLIIGKTAEPSFMQKLTYIALTHDPHRIKEVDTVRAYSSGALYWVEVDIVLPEGMSLKEAHDIGEELQVKLETVEGVERAFVHLDYESSHRPEHFKTL